VYGNGGRCIHAFIVTKLLGSSTIHVTKNNLDPTLGHGRLVQHQRLAKTGLTSSTTCRVAWSGQLPPPTCKGKLQLQHPVLRAEYVLRQLRRTLGSAQTDPRGPLAPQSSEFERADNTPRRAGGRPCWVTGLTLFAAQVPPMARALIPARCPGVPSAIRPAT